MTKDTQYDQRLVDSMKVEAQRVSGRFAVYVVAVDIDDGHVVAAGPAMKTDAALRQLKALLTPEPTCEVRANSVRVEVGNDAHKGPDPHEPGCLVRRGVGACTCVGKKLLGEFEALQARSVVRDAVRSIADRENAALDGKMRALKAQGEHDLVMTVDVQTGKRDIVPAHTLKWPDVVASMEAADMARDERQGIKSVSAKGETFTDPSELLAGMARGYDPGHNDRDTVTADGRSLVTPESDPVGFGNLVEATAAVSKPLITAEAFDQIFPRVDDDHADNSVLYSMDDDDGEP